MRSSSPAPSSQHRPVAVITGGTRGIGLAIARDLAPTHHLVIGGRSAESVADVVASLPSAEGLVADLADCTPGGSLRPPSTASCHTWIGSTCSCTPPASCATAPSQSRRCRTGPTR